MNQNEPCCLSFHLHGRSCSHPYTLSPNVSLKRKSGSRRLHTVGSSFSFIQPAALCPLTGGFKVSPQCSGSYRRETGFSSGTCTAAETEHSLTTPVFSWGQGASGTFSLMMNCSALGKAQWWQSSSYPLQCVQTPIEFFFFSSKREL